MATITLSYNEVIPDAGDGMPAIVAREEVIRDLPDEFVRVVEWLVKERAFYQPTKWDYGALDHTRDGDLEHALQGLGEDSWFWNKGVLNYAHRSTVLGITNPLGVQAVLKLAATIASIPEHLLRGRAIDGLPRPGLSSGNL